MELILTVEKAQHHYREEGRFIVIYKNDLRPFNTLVAAFKYYFILNGEASLWDITEKEELLEKKCFKLLV